MYFGFRRGEGWEETLDFGLWTLAFGLEMKMKMMKMRKTMNENENDRNNKQNKNKRPHFPHNNDDMKKELGTAEKKIRSIKLMVFVYLLYMTWSWSWQMDGWMDLGTT